MLPLWPNGGPSRFEGFNKWLPNGPIVKQIQPIGSILRFLAIYDSTMAIVEALTMVEGQITSQNSVRDFCDFEIT